MRENENRNVKQVLLLLKLNVLEVVYDQRTECDDW